jgi:hypothetical protein
MRALTSAEQEKLKALTRHSVSLAFIEPTLTGLGKSIMDATAPVRQYLLDHGLHDFDNQKQGPLHKVQIEAVILTAFGTKESKASLYRPETKNGDPRIWFSGLKDFVEPNEIIALFINQGKIYVFNLTRLPVEALLSSQSINPLKELIDEIQTTEGAVAMELLGLLKKIGARGPIRAELLADTAVGRTLETQLGIAINSSTKPDYKGIELKSFRKSKGNRKNLFAQVPDWRLSAFKSSAQILDAFGYQRGEDFKLYCTVSTKTLNSQGLSFRLDREARMLHESSDYPEIGEFVSWSMSKLHQRLLEKHSETFWIMAEGFKEDGVEYFHYKQVEHTRKPILTQFDLLLEQGVITMDHLIKRTPTGKTVEKGPLFKIKPNCVGLLFPPSQVYELR